MRTPLAPSTPRLRGRRGRARLDRARIPGALAGALLLAPLLASCGGDSGGGGRPTLNFYSFPDNSGAIQQAVDTCSKNSNGRYVVKYNKLPNGADGQRQQLVRRLAARDRALDILGLDVTWEAEFAEAGWIREWTGDNRAKASEGTLEVPLATATWKDKLYAVPYNSNTQLLWYRSDLVPKPPETWDQMIDMAEDLAKAGKPHLIEIQGAQYEGAVVWFNTLLASAGGTVLSEDASKVAMGQPAVDALRIMKRLATSGVADPSLSVQMEDANRLAMESGTAAFELNYPFVYPSMKANKPDLFKNFKWALYPRVKPDEPAHVTIGGIDLAISAYSKHPDLAFEAALCLRNRENQKVAAIKGGLPPTIADLYDDESLQKDYPFRKDIKTSLDQASVRPKTPAYQNLSIVISHAVSPPASIKNPERTEQSMAGDLRDALESKGLIP
jgi:multiple sugar transport system substrate-binding protein